MFNFSNTPMKTFFLWIFLTLLLAGQHATAQEYFVLQVKGKILVKSSQKEVAPGDMLAAADELVFASQEATAIVMSKTDGRMVLDGKETKKNTEGEFWALLKNAVVPMKQNMKMSTRGADTEAIRNFKDYFGTARFAIIGSELRLAISQESYPVSNERIFVYRYEYEGKPISKVIPFEEGKMVLNQKELYTVNGTLLESEAIGKADIWYFNRSTDDRERVASFTPVFIDEAQLATELVLLKEFLVQYKDKTVESLHQELFSYVRDAYGTTDEAILKKWLKTKKIL